MTDERLKAIVLSYISELEGDIMRSRAIEDDHDTRKSALNDVETLAATRAIIEAEDVE